MADVADTRRAVEQAARRLGQTVREMRLAAGLSEREVAARAGVAEGDVRAVEAGRADVPYMKIRAVAQELGAPLSTIVARSEPPAYR
jgi:transcriptional regulator with XRE-family HTH domain